MPKAQKRWVRVKVLSAAEKAAITSACERLIETLRPRFLPEVRPDAYNYPVAILGKWRGSKYSFITRYRSGHDHNFGAEFDAPFARLDYLEEWLSEIRFDVMWHRHTGQWWRVLTSVPLADALHMIETDPVLHPAL